jgi:Uma2 family endonuclease
MDLPATLVSVEEYLRSSFDDGDREYVDGFIVERNLGEQDHSWVQGQLIVFFHGLLPRLKTFAFPEQRVQVKPTRFRVPDVCVVLGGRPAESIFQTPPFLCIEILSPEDRASRLAEKIADYLDFGVRFVWVIDPELRKGWIHTREHAVEVTETLHTSEPDIALPLANLW